MRISFQTIVWGAHSPLDDWANVIEIAALFLWGIEAVMTIDSDADAAVHRADVEQVSFPL